MSGNGTLKHFRDLMAEARLPERTVPVCLRGDLRGDFEQAERELEQLQESRQDSMAAPGVGELVDRIQSLRQQMRDATVTFRLRALSKPKYHALVAKHPPRHGDNGEVIDADRALDVNSDTFFEELVPLSIVDPELDENDYAQLVELLTDYQFTELGVAALGLNRSEVDIPFSSAVSKLNRGSGGG